MTNSLMKLHDLKHIDELPLYTLAAGSLCSFYFANYQNIGKLQQN